MEAYPLCWPQGWPRTKSVTRSRFSSSFASARDKIVKEINLLGGKQIIISTNIPLKKDGFPYAGQKQPDDKGVAVYFTYKGEQVVFACDRWDKIECNLQAVWKTIEAMRGVERWGVSDMLARAFTGFTALPPARMAKEPTWFEILGVNQNAGFEDIKSAYRKLAQKYHPDNQETGDEEMFKKVKWAYDMGTLSS